MKNTKAVAKKEIKFDLSVLENFVQSGDSFLMNPEAEDFITKWVLFKKMVEKADEQVKKQLQAKMLETNTLKVEGSDVKVYRRYFGDRFESTDNQLALGMGVAFEETKIKLDTAAIDRFVKENGQLPECIKMKERTESIVISGVKENGE